MQRICFAILLSSIFLSCNGLISEDAAFPVSDLTADFQLAGKVRRVFWESSEDGYLDTSPNSTHYVRVLEFNRDGYLIGMWSTDKLEISNAPTGLVVSWVLDDLNCIREHNIWKSEKLKYSAKYRYKKTSGAILVQPIISTSLLPDIDYVRYELSVSEGKKEAVRYRKKKGSEEELVGRKIFSGGGEYQDEAYDGKANAIIRVFKDDRIITERRKGSIPESSYYNYIDNAQWPSSANCQYKEGIIGVDSYEYALDDYTAPLTFRSTRKTCMMGGKGWRRQWEKKTRKTSSVGQPRGKRR